MKTKRIRRRKLKIKNVLIFLMLIIVIVILSNIVYDNLINIKIKNIYITGNNYVQDIEIIREANLENYPYFNKISKRKIEKKLESIDIIKNVEVKKRLFGKIYIEVNEYTPLFYNSSTGSIILDNNKEINRTNISNLPTLNMDNITDKNLLKKLTNKFLKVNEEMRFRISEIKYDPNSVDDERFLMIMNDGNYVYVTLVKIEEINYYLKILPTLDNKKGILNLDYGNNFEIFE